MKASHWPIIVDIVTVIWIAIFILGFFASPALEGTLRTVNIAILSVFITDLGVSYWKVRSPSLFVRKHWLDILMIIPYFRIFRISRILRLLRFVRIARGIRVARSAKIVRAIKVSKWVKFSKGSLIVQEIVDLLRTIKARFMH